MVMNNRLSTNDIWHLSKLKGSVMPVSGAARFERLLAWALVERKQLTSPGGKVIRTEYRRTPAGDAFLRALAGEAPHV